jgi:hypothetical protein
MVGNIASVETIEIMLKNSSQKTGRDPLKRPKRRRKDNIKESRQECVG